MSNEPSKEQVDKSRRTWVAITCVAGGVGGAATVVPFVSTFQPSEKAKAAGAPVEVDIGGLAPGDMMTAEYRGKPIWIVRRTKAMLDSLKKTEGEVADPDSKNKQSELTPMKSCQNKWRSVKEEYLVVVGICTHLGCSPTSKFATGPQPSLPDNWEGGFLCPCHGSTFDLAGRVFKNKPAPDNLEVPLYTFLSDTKLLIGEADAKSS
ncbi:MAG: ubiquinol-cytochrome c reductase iron-sulfur subunit [Aquabacterium sp.]|jgi:ubiquinol-cytochrome c reductase iron-sulfur subunit|nr:MAG: ubiquinol-cytochrome c reductase iron-sulfur subunit [Aquabacterium sp.]TAL15628.1 MAG: ubiquinol-cytochrome c reductase iron-sulfur subunit [Aquabacterium sp.]